METRVDAHKYTNIHAVVTHTHTQQFCLLPDFFTYSPLLLFNRKLVHLLKMRKFILIPLFTCTFAHTPAHLLGDLFIDSIGLFLMIFLFNLQFKLSVTVNPQPQGRTEIIIQPRTSS